LNINSENGSHIQRMFHNSDLYTFERGIELKFHL